MKNKKWLGVLAAACLAAYAPVAHANSSWYWISETRPLDVLPWVASVTVLAEIFLLIRAGRVKVVWREALLVTLANLLSFAAPYVFYFLLSRQEGFPFSKYLEGLPSYIVGMAYAVATIAIELPVVYGGLRQATADRKRLAAVIVLANLLTTVFVAVVERLLCRGRW